jgi:hypothetical protein
LAAASLATPVGRGLAEALPVLSAVAVTVTVTRRISANVGLAAGLSALWVATALVQAG